MTGAPNEPGSETQGFGATTVSDDGHGWPDEPGQRVVFLLAARDRFEASALEQWARERVGASGVIADFIRLGTRQTQLRLANALGSAWVDDAAPGQVPQIWFQPLRLAYFGGGRRRDGGMLSTLFWGVITRPGFLRRRWLARVHPDRVRTIVGRGAWTHDIHGEYRVQAQRSGSSPPFANWLVEQALLVLELAERVARGARYRTPRLLPEHVFAARDYQAQLDEIADGSKLARERADAKALEYLREMAASQTPFSIDLITALYRAAARSSHEREIDIDPEQVEMLSRVLRERPVLFCISHKSMLDTCAFSLVLFDANLPIPLTFGGINLKTPGVGMLARGAGIIFLRRSFRDNAIYKAVFRRYIDYLLEQRFSLLWALEGTRSRTGKLLSPRFGLFNYAVDSILRTRQLDAAFVPVSVTYDQVTEVEDYAIEQRGTEKRKEGPAWMLRFFLRGRRRGRIFVRLGRERSVRELLAEEGIEEPSDDPGRTLLSQSMAFDTAFRMNAATPVTAPALLTLVLLAEAERAMTPGELASALEPFAALARERGAELVGAAKAIDERTLLGAIEQLRNTGLLEWDAGRYKVSNGAHHNAAYYRNASIHHFLDDAIVELALVLAGADSSKDLEAHAISVRATLKFEFYFLRKRDYVAALVARADERFEGWRDAVASGEAAVLTLLGKVTPRVAPAVLGSFVETYAVFSRTLRDAGDGELTVNLVGQCLTAGRAALEAGELLSPESVSKTLYQTAFDRARHRGLLEAGRTADREELATRVQRFADAVTAIRGIER